jgi:adenylosuccinate synthase
MGLQWGDEGKGKMVDILSATTDYVVRCQGGSNAGHTVKVGGKTTVLHLIPSGILSETAVCVIGNGVVVDPAQLLEEMALIEGQGVNISGRLFVSERAHVVFPFHKTLDAAQEAARADRKLGTTGRGIGPSYEDKVARQGLRMADLLRDDLAERLSTSFDLKDRRLRSLGADAGDLDAVVAEFRALGERLRPHIRDTVKLLHEGRRAGKSFFLEGAQGVLLDIDLGTYPFVTSSNTNVGGLLTGSGLPANAIDRVVGVIKAYTTRVGSGPFPTELDDEVGQGIRDRGAEYGATTGRPRRCGWFDAVAGRFAVAVNGVDHLALTKSDVLSGLDEIRICTAYRLDGREIDWFPADVGDLERLEPVYETLPGWKEDISGARAYDALPENMKRYVARIEELVGAPATWISVGPGREETITR